MENLVEPVTDSEMNQVTKLICEGEAELKKRILALKRSNDWTGLIKLFAEITAGLEIAYIMAKEKPVGVVADALCKPITDEVLADLMSFFTFKFVERLRQTQTDELNKMFKGEK